jgi:hypothetical protein
MSKKGYLRTSSKKVVYKNITMVDNNPSSKNKINIENNKDNSKRRDSNNELPIKNEKLKNKK